MWCRYECGYGSKDDHDDSNHTSSIKHGCLVAFSVKQLYVWPEVVEISFYHYAQILIKGEPTHSQDDLECIARMSLYAFQMSQAFKDHIWTQLSLGCMVKEIYNKHKAIWWAQINTREPMIKNDFIRQSDIAYLDQMHKERSWRLHTNLTISIWTWAYSH